MDPRLVLEPTAAGRDVFQATPRVLDGGNANSSSIGPDAVSMVGEGVPGPTGDNLYADVRTDDGRALTIAFRQIRPALVSGATVDASFENPLSYTEGREGALDYRRWDAESGTVTVDAISDEEVVAHLTGARFTATTGTPKPNGARGAFDLDASLRFVRGHGSVSFASVDAPNVSLSPIVAPACRPFAATDSDSTLFFYVQDENRSLRVWLRDADGTLRVGDAFDLGVEGSKAILDGKPDADDKAPEWRAASGKVVVRAIQGRVVTLEIADVLLSPLSGGATGHPVAGGTLVLPVG